MKPIMAGHIQRKSPTLFVKVACCAAGFVAVIGLVVVLLGALTPVDSIAAEKSLIRD